MSHCNHDFWELPGQDAPPDAPRTGVLLMCAFCGERRWLWSDGELQIGPPRSGQAW